MKNITIRNTINCDLETFWNHFFDEEFNKKIFIEDLKYPGWKVLEKREAGDTVTQKIELRPPIDAPGPIKKMMGDGFKLTEDGTLDRKTGVYRFKNIPSSMSDKITISGTLRAEAAGPNATTRIVEMSIEAKVFGLGGTIEGLGAKSTEEGYNAYAVAMNKRLAQK